MSCSEGWCPDCPTSPARVRERAEGVPLYAVETVRMLLDEGLLARGSGDGYELTGSVDELEVPGSLHGLIAARLDGLPAQERALLQDGAVLGKTFPRPAVAALSALPMTGSMTCSPPWSARNSCRSKAIRGRPTTASTGSSNRSCRRWRTTRSRRRTGGSGTSPPPSTWNRTWTGDEDEIVEVIAAHYAEAYRSAPDEPGSEPVRARARDALTRAGRRAQQLAAPRAARGYSSALLGSPIPTKSAPPSWSSPAHGERQRVLR